MNLLFLSIAFPLLGFVVLALSRGRLSENLAALIGVGSVGLSALVALYAGWQFLAAGGAPHVQILWQWLVVEDFRPAVALHLDGLSLTMLGVVTGVGFLIHLFASWYMRGEEGYSRFFAYMNLFVASMLFLVLADNLLLLYLGWEGVGLCSYLLIGFYYSNPANGAAALKAFIVTRVGDVFMAIGLFILFHALGTLHIQELLTLAPQRFASGDPQLTLATLLLLGGAVGKSAQLPLQTWLADAMAGPTPVSALIHAATMVTAGVYLIARCHGLFSLAPATLELVGIVGALTLLLAGFAALVQTDIKRILAYSTMSQIGYMFLALGVGAWSGAIFHLMTHAFFKALLFLASGAVILACHHEQNIFKMGGLRRPLPLAYACFLVGGSALAALPFITAGFYSKDEILWEAFASGHRTLLLVGLIGAFLTSLYTFRLIFIAFHGEAKTEVHAGHGVSHWLPLGVLLVLSTFIGALIHPPLATVLPTSAGEAGGEAKHSLELLSGVIAVSGIVLAALLFLGQRRFVTRLAESAPGRFFAAWWYAAWGFDWLYDRLFVQPYLLLCRLLGRDPFDRGITQIPKLAKGGNRLMSQTESGRLRWYAASLAGGAVLLLGALALV
ncbi:NADH-quinone oxidoreductase subunit L [Pseudomonas sp. PIC25]|uniref:NADH-quinone oxidoreductase subunit L n=1 Tax=Pseudomonas sp. PIC25 TaxID=1958773 RepID=UPI000BABEC49|nr:NADH-quinone oxidoreductase subunit L [Pseudomonas sp. PIC25]PAU55257.1 NADH-quinone oxidoreductase subunit L [Pseudomonas sp. PIC25]